MSSGYSVEVSHFLHRHPGQEQPVSVDQLQIGAGERAVVGVAGG